MPIIIKDFVWSETENTVTIKVPLRGVHHAKADIFYSELYIKASYEQYFFEVFPLHPVKPKESNCTFTPGHILFELIKRQPQIWGNLQQDLPKVERQELKQRCINEEHQRLQKEKEELKNKKSELKRVAVREQMALDAKEHAAIENIKTDEKVKALQSMDLLPKSGPNKQKQKPWRGIQKATNLHQAAPLPPLRTNAVVTVSFTPREFPTPCRESRLEEEDEWLKKQAEARRSVGFISEDLRPEEHNPHFLKCKGDEFLRSRNYLAAISAYSFGIKLNDKFSDLYVGRAEAHLAVGNFNKTINDCTSALDLMKPAVPANLRDRAACIGWRGIALVHLGMIQQGIGELKASVTLQPNENFSSKLDEAEEMLNEAADNT